MPNSPKPFATGLSWPESPRWRNGELFISDVHNFRLVKITSDGSVHLLSDIEGRPAGMDFLADGSILLATGIGRELLRINPDTGEVDRVADLSNVTKAFLNDLISHTSGWSWVGDTGFRFGVDEPVASGSLWAFHPTDGVKRVADEIFFPNGIVVSDDGSTLYLAETFGKCITRFDIGPDGSLSNRRRHAILPSEPDGLCLDAEGCLWVPLLFQGQFIRISPEGEIIETIEFPGKSAIACVAGGDDRKTLFLCVSTVNRADPVSPERVGEIYTVKIAVPGSGHP